MYRHTQIGYLTLAIFLTSAAVVAATTMRSSPAAAIAIAAAMIVVAVLFASLTTEVRDGVLRSHFGPGFWKKQWKLSDVVDATATRTSVLDGWGIRITTRGMLYNVSGQDAVEVVTRSGARFRLGTDEPEALARAIRTAISQSATP